MAPEQPTRIKAVFFDFMGTCLDWHGAVVAATPAAVPRADASALALEWRRQYFLSNAARHGAGLAPEDIDDTLARTLAQVLQQPAFAHLASPSPSPSPSPSDTTPPGPLAAAAVQTQMVQAWHAQRAWPEVSAAIAQIRDGLGADVFVHANGTTRLQLDLVRFSGLRGCFSMLFSSQLLGVYKPHPEAYAKALQLVKLDPAEVVLVAAHAYDLRGAAAAGMKTVYVRRWTDDVDEDVEKLRTEFDAFLDGMEDLPETIAGL